MRTFAQKQKPTQQTGTLTPSNRNLSGFSQRPGVRSLLPSQPIFGNQSVQLKSETEERNTASAATGSTRFSFDLTQVPVSNPAPVQIQPKLRVNTPGDKYEQEADRVAENVMGMPDGTVQRMQRRWAEQGRPVQTTPLAAMITPLVQRQAESEKNDEVLESAAVRDAEELDEEKEEELVQTKTAEGAAPQVTPAIGAGIRSLQGGGRPLSKAERNYFEPRFGTAFADVRMHTDARAARAARSVNARAFTLGRDVVFGSGQYSPGTTSGRSLLAHELTHVVQQRKYGQKIMKKPLIKGIDIYFSGKPLIETGTHQRYPRGVMRVFYQRGQIRRYFIKEKKIDVVGGGHKKGFTDIVYNKKVTSKAKSKSYTGRNGRMPWAVVIQRNQTIHQGMHNSASMACVKVQGMKVMEKINKHTSIGGTHTRVNVTYEHSLLKELCRFRNAYRRKKGLSPSPPCISSDLKGKKVKKRVKDRRKILDRWEKKEKQSRKKWNI